MSKFSIYYPGIKKAWKATEDIKLNAYLNLLIYAHSTITEKILKFEIHDEIPYLSNGNLTGYVVNGEKNLSFVNGLYYEEFYNEDDEKFIKNLLKKMKNRITCPLVYIKGSFFNEVNNKKTYIPCICCGYDYTENKFVIMQPFLGEYISVSLDVLYQHNGQKKMIMLNIPGMNRIKEIPQDKSIDLNIRLYIKKLYRYSDMRQKNRFGIDALKAITKSVNIDEDFIDRQLEWLETAISLQMNLEKKELLILELLKEMYINIQNNNCEKTEEFIHAFEEYCRN